MRTKVFDCVELKHRGAEKIQQEIQGMTLEQELDYWREGTRLLRSRQQLRKEGKKEKEGDQV